MKAFQYLIPSYYYIIIVNSRSETKRFRNVKIRMKKSLSLRLIKKHFELHHWVSQFVLILLCLWQPEYRTALAKFKDISFCIFNLLSTMKNRSIERSIFRNRNILFFVKIKILKYAWWAVTFYLNILYNI